MPANLNAELLRGGMDLMVLSALAQRPMYGYLLQQNVERNSGGRVTVQAGTLYPLLHRLEDDGLVRSRWDETTGRRRKWYELTPDGRRRLVRQARQWTEFADCLRRMLAPVLDAPLESA